MIDLAALSYCLPSLLIGWFFFSIIVSLDIVHKLKVKMAAYVPIYKMVIVSLVYLSFFSLIYIAVVDKLQYQSPLPYYLIIYLPIMIFLITVGHTSLIVFRAITRFGYKSVSKLFLTYGLGIVVSIMTGIVFSIILRTFLRIEIL